MKEFLLKVYSARFDSLMSVMKLLGVEVSEEGLSFKEDKSYNVLDKIGDMLEDYEPLNFLLLDRNNSDGYRLNSSKKLSKDEFLRVLEKNNKQTKDNVEYEKSENEYKYETDGFLGRLKNIRNGISLEEYNIYSKVVLGTARLILSLNADLFSLDQRKILQIKDFSELDDDAREDVISQVIDSKAFADACTIENRFVARQSQEIIDWISDNGDVDGLNGSMKDQLEFLKRSAVVRKEERESRQQKSFMHSVDPNKKREIKDDDEYSDR